MIPHENTREECKKYLRSLDLSELQPAPHQVGWLFLSSFITDTIWLSAALILRQKAPQRVFPPDRGALFYFFLAHARKSAKKYLEVLNFGYF